MKIRPKYSNGYIIFSLILWAVLAVYLGHGELTELTRMKRLLLSFMVIVPFVLVVLIAPFDAPCYAAASIIPLKIMINNGLLNYSLMYVIIILLALRLFNKPKQKPFKTGRISASLFLILITFQLFRAQDLSLGLSKLLDCLVVMVFLYVCVSPLSNAKRIKILRAYLYGVILSIFFILLTHDWNSGLRLGETISLNPNFLGMLSSLSIIYLRYVQTEKRANQWTWIAVVILFFALILTSSRGAILALVTGILVFTISRRNYSKTIALTVLFLIILPAIYSNFLFGTTAGDHLLKGLNLSSKSYDFKLASSLRYKLLLGGISKLKSNPIFGVGWSNFSTSVNIYAMSSDRILPAHNIFLQMAVELGFLGLLAIITWFILIIKRTFFSKNHFGLACTMALLVAGLTQGNFLSPEVALFWPLTLGIQTMQPTRWMSSDKQLGYHQV